MIASDMIVPSRAMRSPSHAGTRPPCRGRSALPDLLVMSPLEEQRANVSAIRAAWLGLLGGSILALERIARALAAAERRLLLKLAQRHDLLPELRPLLVDRGDHRPHRHAEIHQHRLAELQR